MSQAIAIRANVTRQEDVQCMVARVLAGYGRIDVLVNNAGAPGPIVALNEMTGADWHAVFASNVDSVFYAVHEVLPCMMRNHYGRIINVSSSSLRNPPPLRAAYMASKAAVETLSFATSLSFAVSLFFIFTLIHPWHSAQ